MAVFYTSIETFNSYVHNKLYFFKLKFILYVKQLKFIKKKYTRKVSTIYYYFS